jgi:hypothetical protein
LRADEGDSSQSHRLRRHSLEAAAIRLGRQFLALAPGRHRAHRPRGVAAPDGMTNSGDDDVPAELNPQGLDLLRADCLTHSPPPALSRERWREALARFPARPETTAAFPVPLPEFLIVVVLIRTRPASTATWRCLVPALPPPLAASTAPTEARRARAQAVADSNHFMRLPLVGRVVVR